MSFMFTSVSFSLKIIWKRIQVYVTPPEDLCQNLGSSQSYVKLLVNLHIIFLGENCLYCPRQWANLSEKECVCGISLSLLCCNVPRKGVSIFVIHKYKWICSRGRIFFLFFLGYLQTFLKNSCEVVKFLVLKHVGTWKIHTELFPMPLVIMGGLTCSTALNNFKTILMKSYLVVTFDVLIFVLSKRFLEMWNQLLISKSRFWCDLYLGISYPLSWWHIKKPSNN
jgi:hypothetical protein